MNALNYLYILTMEIKMKRIVDHYLSFWMDDSLRKPLLLRGARQVGKTYAARQLGKKFESFVEINLELNKEAQDIFAKNLDPHRIMRDLAILKDQPIIPGKTLLFLDEIQIRPDALIALRYFYEMIPELHVIAAGSLLDFAIEQVGIPVGRVESLYIYPLSFIEFLSNQHPLLLQEIIDIQNQTPSTIAHTKLLENIGYYLAIGGMPEVVKTWIDTQDPFSIERIHNRLISTYKQDFAKYAKKHQIKYVDLVFRSIPDQLGNKFKYNRIEGEFRKRELAPAMELLDTAGLAHKIFNSSGQGIPLGAQADMQDYKAIFIDIGLTQTILGLNLSDWFLHPLESFINKGALVEAFIGQEMLVYTDPFKMQQLYYWHRQAKSSQAEIDYLMQKNQQIIPIEVKSGSGTALKSMRTFLASHASTPYGIRFSTQPFSIFESLHSYPLYAVANICGSQSKHMRDAISSLL